MIIGTNLENKVIFRLQIYYTYYMQVKLKTAFCVFIHWIVIDTPQATFCIEFYYNL